MARGRKGKRKINDKNDKDQQVNSKRGRTTVQIPEIRANNRSTRSTAKATDVSKEATGKFDENTTFFQGIPIPDPRKIMYVGKGKNNNAKPGNNEGNLHSDADLNKQPSPDCSGGADAGQTARKEISNCQDLIPTDPGTELDYEDNLDVQMTVDPPNAGDDGEITDEEESTLLSMLKTNPKLKKIFRRLVHDEQTNEKQINATQQANTGKQVEKALSDTTIYAPACVRRDPQIIASSPILRNRLQTATAAQASSTDYNNVAQILDRMRLENLVRAGEPGPSRVQEDPRPGTSQAATEELRPRTQDELDAEAVQRARKIAQDKIVEAEKFRASIDVPPGMSRDNDDDAFFMNTCHTEQSETERISKGNFMDLNKIYPRQNDYKSSQDNRLEIVNRDGHTYFVPAGENTKRVFNYHTWQKAFRVYATIYSRANPHRAAEILQYMDVIGNAASTFIWENVAAYDYVHRQLMHQKPNRSWAKIYQQGWSMSMKEHVFSRGSNSNGQRQSNGKRSEKIDPYCWRFNKNNCKRVNCRYEHKCSYCGAAGHGSYNCRKKAEAEEKKPEETAK